MESAQVTADVVEANEFRDLSARYAVQAVPKTVVGETVQFVGAGPEAMLLKHVQQAAEGAGLAV